MWKKANPQPRRAATRYPVRWPARVVQMGAESFVVIRNVSEGGFLLTLPRESQFLEDLPTVVHVRLMGQEEKFSGRLRYYEFTDADQCFGFQFGHLTPKAKAILDQWIEVAKNNPEQPPSRFARLLNAFTNLLKK